MNGVWSVGEKIRRRSWKELSMQSLASVAPARRAARHRGFVQLQILAGAALGATVLIAAPVSAGAQGTGMTAPKAYIGLFKDSAVAVLDTSSNKVMKTIPIPAGPHGLVATPAPTR